MFGLCISRGTEALQPGAAQRGDHRPKLHPWRRPGHFLEDLDQSRNRDGSLHWETTVPRTCGPVQEQQPDVGGERTVLQMFCSVY